MGKEYWIARKRAAMKMAHTASSAEARLIHYDLAGRYSLKAAHSLPFLLRRKEAATQGERAALQLPVIRPIPPTRGDPKSDGR